MPTQVDQVLLQFYQRDLVFGQRPGRRFLPVQRVHTRIVSNPGTLGEFAGQPGHVRGFYQVQNFKQILRHLPAHLHRVATVYKNGGPFAQHNHHPGRACEITYPQHAFILCRQVFAKVFIGARDDKGIQVEIGHLRAHTGQTFSH